MTCFSRHSRNRGFGEKIGSGMSAEAALASSAMVVEGVATTASVRALAARHGVELPIADAVAAILAGDLQPAEAVAALMARDPRLEGLDGGPTARGGPGGGPTEPKPDAELGPDRLRAACRALLESPGSAR